MKILKIVIFFALIGLGIISGIAKLLLMPEEVDLFTKAGLSKTFIVLLGIAQLTGVILMFLKNQEKLVP